jgi:hypothetical protein
MPHRTPNPEPRTSDQWLVDVGGERRTLNGESCMTEDRSLEPQSANGEPQIAQINTDAGMLDAASNSELRTPNRWSVASEQRTANAER